MMQLFCHSESLLVQCGRVALSILMAAEREHSGQIMAFFLRITFEITWCYSANRNTSFTFNDVNFSNKFNR